jgi:hypothetical protein
MPDTIVSTAAPPSRRDGGRLPRLRDLNERTPCMYINTGVMRRKLQGSGEVRRCAAVACRRLLARATNPPGQVFIDAGLVPLIVQMLDVPELLDDTMWMLINLAAGTHEHTTELVRCGAVRPLVRLLSQAACYKHAQHAAWALANVARDMRDVLFHGALPPLVALTEHFFWCVSYAGDGLCGSSPPYRLHQAEACPCASYTSKLRIEVLQTVSFVLR